MFATLFTACKKNNPENNVASGQCVFDSYQLLSFSYEQFYAYASAEQGDEVKALSETAKWLQNQPTIKSVYITDDTYLVAELQNGLQFQLILNYVDKDGKSLYRGGKHGTGQIMRAAGAPQCPNSMPNKKVLLWGARYTEFDLETEYAEIGAKPQFFRRSFRG